MRTTATIPSARSPNASFSKTGSLTDVVGTCRVRERVEGGPGIGPGQQRLADERLDDARRRTRCARRTSRAPSTTVRPGPLARRGGRAGAATATTRGLVRLVSTAGWGRASSPSCRARPMPGERPRAPGAGRRRSRRPSSPASIGRGATGRGRRRAGRPSRSAS